VVTGEVAIGKRQVQETQRVSDTVQREEAHLERSGDVNVQSTGTEDVTDQTTP
jgi:stress response protein YsnF